MCLHCIKFPTAWATGSEFTFLVEDIGCLISMFNFLHPIPLPRAGDLHQAIYFALHHLVPIPFRMTGHAFQLRSNVPWGLGSFVFHKFRDCPRAGYSAPFLIMYLSLMRLGVLRKDGHSILYAVVDWHTVSVHRKRRCWKRPPSAPSARHWRLPGSSSSEFGFTLNGERVLKLIFGSVHKRVYPGCGAL